MHGCQRVTCYNLFCKWKKGLSPSSGWGPLTAPVTHLVLQAHPATAPSLPAFSRDVGMSCVSIVYHQCSLELTEEAAKLKAKQ